MQKQCVKCNAVIPRTHVKANNVKYCKVCRSEAYKYTEKHAENQRKRQIERAKEPHANKIKCLICGLYYRRPIAHARQIHGTNEREYKHAFGLEHKKGIITEQAREILRDHVNNNFDTVVVYNLLQKGKKTRFRKNHKQNYKRSPQTLARLRELYKLNKKHAKKTNQNTR